MNLPLGIVLPTEQPHPQQSGVEIYRPFEIIDPNHRVNYRCIPWFVVSLVSSWVRNDSAWLLRFSCRLDRSIDQRQGESRSTQQLLDRHQVNRRYDSPDGGKAKAARPLCRLNHFVRQGVEAQQDAHIRRFRSAESHEVTNRRKPDSAGLDLIDHLAEHRLLGRRVTTLVEKTNAVDAARRAAAVGDERLIVGEGQDRPLLELLAQPVVAVVGEGPCRGQIFGDFPTGGWSAQTAPPARHDGCAAVGESD